MRKASTAFARAAAGSSITKSWGVRRWLRAIYFRLMMIGYFEGLDSERGIAWRVADSLTLRQFLRIGLDERTPDHVTISRTRRLIGAEAHQQVFAWVLKRLARGGLLKGKTDRRSIRPRWKPTRR